MHLTNRVILVTLASALEVGLSSSSSFSDEEELLLCKVLLIHLVLLQDACQCMCNGAGGHPDVRGCHLQTSWNEWAFIPKPSALTCAYAHLSMHVPQHME